MQTERLRTLPVWMEQRQGAANFPGQIPGIQEGADALSGGLGSLSGGIDELKNGTESLRGKSA